MENVAVTNVRNFTIAGHAGSGKTALSDPILFKGAKVSRLGSVYDGNSVSNDQPDERERQHSLYATPLCCEWKDHALCFIDTPDYADYFGDAKAALTVCDTALIVVNASEGVEKGTRRSWNAAIDYNVTRNCKERIGHFVIMNGKDHVNISQVKPGFIAAISKQLQEAAAKDAADD